MIRDDGYKKKYSPPPHHALKGGWQDKSLYILSLIGKGSAADVAGKIAELESSENVASLEEHVEKALSQLSEKDIVNNALSGQVMIYSLHEKL